ncbi:DUF6476 family protein [Frigidibacter sp. ROC022]|uniref:DUF6476 family protein n=1 Tax=Frigidibacter sp. ROC022 TaxID=2971796 RepID=UPI00215B1738|nr:DUF6476 family protein [Frigidibacter sp. ROC022]MCR8725310.1 DUF6476 family protein [Frigidibacter sp. ROC022]
MNETPERAETAETAEDAATARNLRLLRWLVTLLTTVMIVGIVVIIGLMIWRLNQGPGPTPRLLPESIALPEGVKARAVTLGEGFVLVLTEGDEVLVYDAESGKLRQRARLTDE